MPKRKLKVFQAQFGFYDTVVAASSQAAALRAWGTHQNLFAGGAAKIATDAAAVATALQHPDTPLRRPIGSTDPFELEPVTPPKVPDAPKPTAPRQTAKKPAPAPPPPADRTALDNAEAALRQLDDAREREEGEFRRRQDELNEAKAAAREAYVAARKAAATTVSEARNLYRSAGGED